MHDVRSEIALYSVGKRVSRRRETDVAQERNQTDDRGYISILQIDESARDLGARPR